MFVKLYLTKSKLLARIGGVVMAKENRLEEEVYQFILKKIQTFIWQPGEHIKEQEVARELNTSRTPVRKALKRLEKDNYVLIEPYKGAKILKPILDAKSFQHYTEVIELLFMHYFHRLESKEVELNVSRLLELYYEMNEYLYGDGSDFETKEIAFWEELLYYEENQYGKLIILNSIRNLYPAQGKIRKVMVQNRQVKLKHMYHIINYLKETNYPYVRREVRILINQMNLDIVQGL